MDLVGSSLEGKERLSVVRSMTLLKAMQGLGGDQQSLMVNGSTGNVTRRRLINSLIL